jgi:galactokinase
MPFVDAGVPADLLAAVRNGFASAYDTEPTVVARAPGRVNLIGEHTDYNRGLVLPVALPHATYAAAAPRTDGQVRVASAEEPEPWTGRVDALGPGQVEGWAAYAAGVVWALRETGLDVPGIDLFVHGTVPLGAGLSSSAALECSVALATCAALGQPEPSRDELIGVCMRAETEVAGAPTGGMDQTVSMLASEDAALLIDFDSGEWQPVALPLQEAGLALLVVDTRVTHALVDGGYGERRADCEAAAEALGLPSLRQASLADVEGLEDERVQRRARHIVTEVERVREVVDAVAASDWTEVGRLFAASHVSMRDDFEISCPELDTAVATAVEAGAVGARMTGGGFGGSAVALVPVERIDAVARAVDAAFAASGFRAPQYLRVEPASAAALVD